MIRRCSIPILLLALATALSAAQQKPAADKKADPKKADPKKADPKKAQKPKAPTKPDNATWLDKNKGSWYILHTPEGFTTREKYPLIVLTPSSRHGGIGQDVKNWLPLAKTHGVFLAALELPRDYKDNKQKAQADMVVKILKENSAIERRSVALLGVGGGANEVLSITAAHPRLFSAAIALSPDKYPDISKVTPGGPSLSRSYTPIFLTVDPKSKESVTAFVDARKEFGKKRLHLVPQKAEGVAGGKASEDELRFVNKILLEKCYSRSKRSEVVAALRKSEAEQKAKEAAEKAKIAATEKPKEAPASEGPASPKPESKDEPKKMDPDDLLEKAREYDDGGKYLEAFNAYARLAKENPDSDYSRVAEARMKEFKQDPKLAQAIADAEVGGEARSLLTRARNFAMGKMLDKAVPEYEKIIQKFPGTTYAEAAQRELDRLKGKE